MRHRVMYPKKNFDFVKLPKDEIGMHFGLYENKKIMSVVSLFIENNKMQFRKMATEVEQQGNGYGTELLNHVFNKAISLKIQSVWCNARLSKTSFYKKFGMIETNKKFNKAGINFVVMEKML